MTIDSPTGVVSKGAPEQLSQTVIMAVASALDVDPIDIDTPLYNVIDPDALNRLFTASGSRGSISFTFFGCRVVAQADGEVRVRAYPVPGNPTSAGVTAAN